MSCVSSLLPHHHQNETEESSFHYTYKELFHPIVVIFMFEEAQYRKVRSLEVAVHLCTSGTTPLGVVTCRSIPLFS